jgi:hypothetical protein
MGFRREVNHGARAVLCEQLGQKRSIANIALHKAMLRVAFQRLQVGQVACVGQGVEVEDGFLIVRTPLQYEI